MQPMWHGFHTKKNTVHIISHTGKNLYQFGKCDMAITKQANLTVHIRPHTGYKPYQCSQCENDLAENWILKDILELTLVRNLSNAENLTWHSQNKQISIH